MEDHLFDSLDLREVRGPIIGKITGIILPADPANPIGISLYQVECYPSAPFETTVDMPPMPFAGQQAGGVFDTEWTIPVDTYVLVGFIEGDSGRPYVDRIWYSQDTETEVKATSGEIPRLDMRLNGAKLLVDKDGDLFVSTRSSGKLEIRNAARTVVATFEDNGLVTVGASANAKTLVNSNFIINLANTFTSTPVVAGDGGAALKTAIAAALSGPLYAYKTSKLKAE